MNETRTEITQLADSSNHFSLEYSEVNPVELSARYPYVLEKLKSLWLNPLQARDYFQELLMTQRANRQGFPMDVYKEIFSLSEYYNRLHPAPKNGDDNFWAWVVH